MPLTLGDFPHEVQVAFFVYGYLSDRYEGMSGTYMGKDWGIVEFLFDVHKIKDKVLTLYFCKVIEMEAVKISSEKSEARRKADDRKATSCAGSGKTYTHNVQG